MARLRIFLVFGLFTLTFVPSAVRGSDYSYESYDDGGYDWGSAHSNYFDKDDYTYAETETETSTMTLRAVSMTITGAGRTTPNSCDWTPMKNSIRGFPSYTLNMIRRSSSRDGSQAGGRGGSMTNVSNGWGSSQMGQGGRFGSGGIFGMGNSRGSSGFGLSNALGRGGNYGMFGSMGSSARGRGGMFGLNSSWDNYGRSLGNSGYPFSGSGMRLLSNAKSGAQSGKKNPAMQFPNMQPNYSTGSSCNKCGMSQLSFARTSNWNKLKKH